MKQNILHFTDTIFRPVIKGINFWPFTQKIKRHTVNDQLRNRYLNFVTRLHDFYQIAEVNPAKDIKYLMKCMGARGYVDMMLITTGEYEQEITKVFLKYVKPGMSFIDIGANIGFYSLLSSYLVGDNGKVISFEPVTENFNRLKENISLNKRANVELHNIGLGSVDTSLEINLNSEAGHHSIINDRDHTNKKETIEIKKLDNVINLSGQELFIKIDTEGYEFEALKGAINTLKNNKCTVIFEFTPLMYKLINSDYIKYSLEILLFLQEIGYVLYEINEDGNKLVTPNIEYIETLKNQVNLLCTRV